MKLVDVIHAIEEAKVKRDFMYERVKLKQEDFPSISGNLIDQMNEMDEEELLRMLSEEFENKKDKGSEND